MPTEEDFSAQKEQESSIYDFLLHFTVILQALFRDNQLRYTNEVLLNIFV